MERRHGVMEWKMRDKEIKIDSILLLQMAEWGRGQIGFHAS